MEEKEYIFNPGNMGMVADIPLPGMTDYCFVFQSSTEKINAFLEKEFSAFGDVEIKALNEFITLQFQVYNRSFPTIPNFGVTDISFLEWAFSVPVKFRKNSDEWYEWLQFIPCHVLNNMLGVVPGREFFGFRKNRGVVEIPSGNVPVSFNVQGWTMPVSGQGNLTSILGLSPVNPAQAMDWDVNADSKVLENQELVKAIDSALVDVEIGRDVLGIMFPIFLGWKNILPFNYPESPATQMLTGIGCSDIQVSGSFIPGAFKITNLIEGDRNYPLDQFLATGDESILGIKLTSSFKLDLFVKELALVNPMP